MVHINCKIQKSLHTYHNSLIEIKKQTIPEISEKRDGEPGEQVSFRGSMPDILAERLLPLRLSRLPTGGGSAAWLVFSSTTSIVATQIPRKQVNISDLIVSIER